MKLKTVANRLTFTAENDADLIALAELVQRYKRGAIEAHPDIADTLELFSDGEPWQATAVAAHFDISATAANNRLRKLSDLGLLTRERIHSDHYNANRLYAYRKAEPK